MYRCESCDGGYSKHVSVDEYSILNIWSAELYIQTFEKKTKRKRKEKKLEVLWLFNGKIL
jgi:hypothetical protein